MVREIVKDIMFLGQKSEPAGPDDLQVAKDLQDTLTAHRGVCVGMAANMIGVKKRIIIVSTGFADVVMFNPQIISQTGPYSADEGCLSLSGTRTTKRFQKIRVRYQDMSLQSHTQDFSGWIAQIIQHECDHLDGIII